MQDLQQVPSSFPRWIQCLFVCLSVCLFVCFFVCLFVCFFFCDHWLVCNTSLIKAAAMGWFQVAFSRKLRTKALMSPPQNGYSKELSQMNWNMYKRMRYSNRSWFWGTFHKINVFVVFWAKHKAQLKFFYRDMVYIILIHLLNQVT